MGLINNRPIFLYNYYYKGKNMKQVVITKRFEDLTIEKFNKLIDFNNLSKSDDREIKLLECLSNLTQEEILNLEFNDYITHIKSIEEVVIPQTPVLKDTFEFNGVTYSTKAVDGDFNFKTRDILAMKKVIETNPLHYAADLAALLFVNENASTEETRTIFEANMTMDYLYFYLIKLQKTLNDNGFGN